MRRIQTVILCVGLLCVPFFVAFLSYDAWLWQTGARTPDGARVAVIRMYGKPRYVAPGQLRIRDVLQAATLITLAFLVGSAALSPSSDT